MEIYIILLVICIAFWVINSNNKNRKLYISVLNKKLVIDLETLLYNILFLFIIIVMVFRSSKVGTDLPVYLNRFESIGRTDFANIFSLSSKYSFEYGFTILNKILFIICPHKMAFMFATSLISLFGFYYAIKKYSNLKFLSVFLFITFCIMTNSMNTIRQYMAISILLYSLKYIIEKKSLLHFLILVLIATSIHSTSLIFMIVYPLSLIITINKYYLFVLISTLLIAALFGKGIISLIIENTSFAWYLNRTGGSGEEMLLILSIIYAFCYILNSKYCKINMVLIWMHMLAMMLIFNVLSINFYIMERMMRYFSPCILILIPNSLSILPDRRKRTFLIIIVMLCFFLYFIYIMSSPESSGNTNEYKFSVISILQGKE